MSTVQSSNIPQDDIEILTEPNIKRLRPSLKHLLGGITKKKEKSPSTRQKYTNKFKLNVVVYAKQNSFGEAAKKFGVSVNSINNWKRQIYEIEKLIAQENSTDNESVGDGHEEDEEQGQNLELTQIEIIPEKTFGTPKFSKTNKGYNFVYDSILYRGHKFRFRENDDGLYECRECLRMDHEANDSIVPSIRIYDGMILDDPDNGHFCLSPEKENLFNSRPSILSSSEQTQVPPPQGANIFVGHQMGALNNEVEQEASRTTHQVSETLTLMKSPIKDLTNENQYGFIYCINAIGYREDELKIDIEHDHVIVEGEHKENTQTNQIRTTLWHKIAIPNQIDKSTVQAIFQDNGQLIITGEKIVEKRSVSIIRKKIL